MAENPSGGQPPATVSPAAASAASSSFTERVLKAKSPAEIRALKEEALQPAPVTPPPKVATPDPVPAETPPAEPAAEPPASEETPAAEEAPQGETPAAEPAGETDEGEEDDGGEGPVTPHSGKRAHLRLADNDDVGRLAASFKKRNRDWTLEQSLEAAKKQLGIKAEAPDGAPPAKPKSEFPETIEAVDTAENELLEKRAKLFTELNFEEVQKIDVALRKLDRHRQTLERDLEHQKGQQVTDYQNAYKASEARAADLYPFSVDPESPAAKRMVEIETTLKENGDPLYNSPDKPLRIAQMVAAEMKIAPRQKGAPVAPAKPATPVTPAPKKGVLPGGNSRTTQPVSVQPAIDTEINGIKTIADIRKFRQKHGLPV